MKMTPSHPDMSMAVPLTTVVPAAVALIVLTSLDCEAMFAVAGISARHSCQLIEEGRAGDRHVAPERELDRLLVRGEHVRRGVAAADVGNLDHERHAHALEHLGEVTHAAERFVRAGTQVD